MGKQTTAIIMIESGIGAFSGDPFCQVRLDHINEQGVAVASDILGQLTPGEVRTMAGQWTETAAAAEYDAHLFAELRATGVEDEAISALVRKLRERRGAEHEEGSSWPR